MYTRILLVLWVVAVLGLQAWMKWGPDRGRSVGGAWACLILLCIMPCVLAVITWWNRSRSPRSLDGLKCPKCGFEEFDSVPGAPWRGGYLGFPSAHCQRCGELVTLREERCGSAVPEALTRVVLAVLAAIVLGVAFYFTFVNR